MKDRSGFLKLEGTNLWYAQRSDGPPLAFLHAGIFDSRSWEPQLDRTWGLRDTEPRPMASVENGRWRLFHFTQTPGASELYDLSIDLGEENNVAAARPEVTAALTAEVVEYLSSPEPPWGAPDDVPLSDFELGQQRALGYVIDEAKKKLDEPPEDGNSAE